MSWLPGWGSAESAGWWSQLLFWVGIVCFVFLGATQIVSHLYALRRAELVAGGGAGPVQTVEAATRPAHSGAQPSAHTNDGLTAGALVGTVVPTASAAVDPQASLGASIGGKARHLTRGQYDALLAGLKRIKSNAVQISMPMDTLEAVTFGAEFVSVFQQAGWSARQIAYSGEPFQGLQVTINEADAHAGRFPGGAQELVALLMKQGLTQGLYTNPAVPRGTIELRIGERGTAAPPDDTQG